MLMAEGGEVGYLQFEFEDNNGGTASDHAVEMVRQANEILTLKKTGVPEDIITVALEVIREDVKLLRQQIGSAGASSGTSDERIGQTLRLKPDAWEQLKHLAAEQKKPAHDLLLQGVELLFARYRQKADNSA
jgi:hypothetical protein